MKDISPFQLIILGVFSVAILVGVFFLATYESNPIAEGEIIGSISIWGTYDSRIMNTWLRTISDGNENLMGISYQEFSSDDFSQQILVALAENRAPDLLLLDNTELYEQYNRILTLDKDVISKNSYKNTFLEVSELYFTDAGILGMPLIVDPIVMYWNRNLFSSAGLVKPPVSWKEFFDLIPVFTVVDNNLTITQTALPFGEVVNVTNMKEILATLLLQTGNPIVSITEQTFSSVLEGDESTVSAYQALDFYTTFSDPSGNAYSWNRSLPASVDYFLGGKAAVYFGYASETKPLQLKNPNLNFDVAEVPQSESLNNKRVYAKLYGLFIPLAAPDPTRSYRALTVLTSQEAGEVLQDLVKLASPRRDLAGQTASDDVFTEVFRKEAIYSLSYIDPQDRATDHIFGSMIDLITSGQKTIDEATRLTDQEINVLFK